MRCRRTGAFTAARPVRSVWERRASRTPSNKLGNAFERQIADTVREDVPRTDYLVRPGVQRSDNGEGEMYDADLILYDVRRRKLFFVQAKWKRDSRTASLDDELHDWRAKNWPLTKGIKRLSALRKRLSERVVLDQVRASLGDIKLSDEHVLNNAHFIVVHTLPYFNAYEIDGVAVYEWNMFRNALQRGAIHRTWSPDGSLRHAVLLPPLQHDSIIPLEDPQRILDHYCAAIGMDMSTFPAMMQDRQDARYGFNLTVPSATWWQRLWRRDRLRIARPYG
jgi:hypothetical protein